MEQTTNDTLMDNYPEKTYKRLKMVYFIIKALFIGVIAFFLTQGIFVLISDKDLLNDNENEVVHTEDDLMGHNYCGTFFIDGTYGFYYGDMDNYNQYEQANKEIHSTTLEKVSIVCAVVFIIGIVLSFTVFFKNASKRQLFYKRSSKWVILSGVLLLVYKLIAQIMGYYSFNVDKQYYVGIMKDSSYYFQVYDMLALPCLMIMLGLILRKHEHILRGENKGSYVMNVYAVITGVVSLGLILVRLIVRIYELICALAEWNNNAMLPFYSTFIPLPRGMAKNIDSYTNVILFRFIKDAPVFTASGVAVIMLMLVMFSCARGEINTESNRSKLKLSMIALTASSVLFNIMGLHEVTLFNNGFTGVFGHVVYTMGIRALCEPALYAFAIYVVYIFMKLVPSQDEEKVNVSGEDCTLAPQTT